MAEAFEITEDYAAIMGACGLTGLAEVFACKGGRPLDKPGLEAWRQRWRLRLEAPGQAARTVYLKRFDRPPFGRQLQRWLCGHLFRSTAGIEWDNARALEAAGIPAARAVAWGQWMAGPWEVRSFLVLEEVPGESLERWIPRALADRTARGDHVPAGALIEGLARFVAAFHRAGFVHRDLYTCHIFMVDGDSPSAHPVTAPSFRLIDLQRVFRPRLRVWRWRIKDLAALDYSTPADRIGRTDRLRFLCRYARCMGGRALARRLVKPIAARTRRLVRRRGPVLAGPPATTAPGDDAARILADRGRP